MTRLRAHRALPSFALALLVAACGSADDAVSFGTAGGAAGASIGGRGGESQGGSTTGGGAEAGAPQGGKGGTASKGGSGGTASKGGSGGTSSQGGAAGEAAAGGTSAGGTSGKGGNGGAGTGGKGGVGTGGKGGNDTAGAGGNDTAGAGGNDTAGAGGNDTAGAGGSDAAGAGGSDAAGAGGSDAAGAGGSGAAGVGGAGGAQSGGSGGGAPLCGDGLVNRPNEACDGQDFGNTPAICPAGTKGTVTCSATCQVDTSACVAPVLCGNGVVDDGEACDSKSPRCQGCQIVCNSAEKAFEGRCYGLTAPQSFGEAEATCVQRGGHLVTINGGAENKLVYDLAGGNPSQPLAAKIWIGLNDRQNEGTFRWVSGSNASYRNFREGEPNAATPNEDCAAMYLQLGTWNDDECNKPFVGVCEFNPQAP